MADPIVFNNAAIWVGPYDITSELNAVNLSAKRAELPDSRFGDDIGAIYPGIMMPEASVAGFYTAGGSDAQIAAGRIIASAPDASMWPLTLAPPYAPAATPAAAGNNVYTLRGCQTAYKFGAAHGQSLPYDLKSASRSGNGVLDRLTVELPKATMSVTTTSTGRQYGALSAAQKLVAVIHAFVVTGGTWTLTIESDDNSGFTTPTVRATFTGITALGVAAMEVAGAVTDDWWRAVLTKAGGTSINAAVLLGVTNL